MFMTNKWKYIFFIFKFFLLREKKQIAFTLNGLSINGFSYGSFCYIYDWNKYEEENIFLWYDDMIEKKVNAKFR